MQDALVERALELIPKELETARSLMRLLIFASNKNPAK